MSPPRNPADKATGAITTNIPHEVPRDNQPTPRAQGINPTTHQPRRTAGILTTCAPDKAPRGDSPVPGVQRATSTKRRLANPPELARLPTKSTDTPPRKYRKILPAPAVQTATSIKHQSTNPPGMTRVPIRHQPVGTPGTSDSGFRPTEVSTFNSPPRPLIKVPPRVLSC